MENEPKKQTIGRPAGGNVKQRRAKQKAKLRAERKARMIAARDAGKSKRDADAIRRFRAWKHAHRAANCGNVGCRKCFP